jgi:UPF0755 protein
VESEAQLDDERRRIARVYLNRLELGMPLQADPTVAYGMGMRPRSRLYFKNLRVDTPFNTYIHPGLPPGPICNPGMKSIRAVLDPMPGVRDLYFVAKGQGRHAFARTYAEHLANIRRIRSTHVEGPEAQIMDSLLVKDSVAAVPANAINVRKH